MNKVSPNREKKQKIVAELSEKLSRAKGLVFTNYQGLTHKQLEALKKAIKPLNAELTVTKNTLLKLALEKVSKDRKVSNVLKGEPLFDTSSTSDTFDTFRNPTATLFLYADSIEPLKQLAKAIREFNLPTIKVGIIEEKTLTSDEVIKLSTLPSRDVLIAQLIFQIKAPVYGLHRALTWNMQRLVMTLKAVENLKSQKSNVKSSS